ncbi:MAG TPA: hypothetical protein G4N93_00630 [Dehalococcoidia bacterium]|nr:hypothetical protein [Dehalococcoidia bacterium]
MICTVIILYKGYDYMNDFTATVEDKHLAEVFKVAIDGKYAFRRFKDILAHYPEERESWFRLKDDGMEQKASE